MSPAGTARACIPGGPAMGWRLLGSGPAAWLPSYWGTGPRLWSEGGVEMEREVATFWHAGILFTQSWSACPSIHPSDFCSPVSVLVRSAVTQPPVYRSFHRSFILHPSLCVSRFVSLFIHPSIHSSVQLSAHLYTSTPLFIHLPIRVFPVYSSTYPHLPSKMSTYQMPSPVLG